MRTRLSRRLRRATGEDAAVPAHEGDRAVGSRRHAVEERQDVVEGDVGDDDVAGNPVTAADALADGDEPPAVDGVLEGAPDAQGGVAPTSDRMETSLLIRESCGG